MKEKVLAVLIQQTGAFVSGEEISKVLGVSRAAVWKAIQALEKEGYQIEGLPKRGYRLISKPDRLTAGNILPQLDASLHSCLLCFDSIDSTNNYAKKLSLSGENGTRYIVADAQTSGRGRRGRSFYSPAGLGIYLTALYHPAAVPEMMSNFTAYVAVAVCLAIEKTTGLAPGIKWPNDILIGGKKVCGILTEMALEGESGAVQYLITGMGINALQEPSDFPEEIREIAGSLKMAGAAAFSRASLCAALIQELDAAYRAFLERDENYWEAYRRRCLTLGQSIYIISGNDKKAAVAKELAPDFGLTVAWEDGSCGTVYAGEVSVRAQDPV